LALLYLLTLSNDRCYSMIPLATKEIEDARDHVIMVDEDGTFVDPAVKWKVANPADEPGLKNVREQLDRIARNLRFLARNGKTVRLLVFVHGGMVTYEDSYQTYRQLFGPMRAAGYYPLFIVWNSGWATTYFDHLVRVRQGEIVSPPVGYATAPFVAATDILGAVVRAPIVWGREAVNDYQTTEWPGGAQAGDHRLVESYLSGKLPDNFLAGDDRRSLGERARYAAMYALTFPVKYLVASPIIDGLGTNSWDNMLRRTGTMFDPLPRSQDIYSILSALPAGQDKQEALKEWYGRKPGVMWVVSERLSSWSREDDLRLEVELYGHSMGAIILNNLLRAAPDLRARKVVYLAAACSIKDWEESVWPYLRTGGSSADFYSISIHRLREESERNPVVAVGSTRLNLDLAPRGSLLDWIDNFLSDPATIEDRTLGRWTNLTRVAPQIPDDLQPRIYLHAFDAISTPGDTPPPQPQSHSETAAWPFWLPEYQFPKTNADTPPRLGTIPARPTFTAQ
jgi:hypothetical protein